MALVREYILTFHHLENDKAVMAKINTQLACNHDGQTFGPDIAERPDIYGGAKYLSTHVHIAAFNYVSPESLTNILQSVNWIFPDDVRLYVAGEDDMHFHERVINV